MLKEEVVTNPEVGGVINCLNPNNMIQTRQQLIDGTIKTHVVINQQWLSHQSHARLLGNET